MSTLLPLLVQQQQGGGQLEVDETPQQVAAYSVMVDWDGLGYTSEDELVGVAGYGVKSLRIRRGRDDDQSAMVAGECEIVLHDPDGRYNPQNAASPHYGRIIPMRKVRVTASNDGGTTVHPLFTGFLRQVESDQSVGVQETRFVCSDAFVMLAAYTQTITMVDGTNSINTREAILTMIILAGYFGSEDRIDNGDLLGDGSTFEASGAMAGIDELLTISRGVFYFASDGTAVFEDRYARGARSSSATFTDSMTRIVGGTDLDKIYNVASVTKTGGTPQGGSDVASQLLYGVRSYPDIESAYLQDDTQAGALANYIVAQHANPRPPVWGMDLINRDATTLGLILERELQDRITVTDSRGGTSDDYHVEGIEHEVTDGGKYHRCRLRLSQRAAEAFTVGVSLIGGTDLISY